MKREVRVFLNDRGNEAWMVKDYSGYTLQFEASNRENNFDDLESAVKMLNGLNYTKEINKAESEYKGIRES